MSALAQGCDGGWKLCHGLTVHAPPTGDSGMWSADRLAEPGTVLCELFGPSLAWKIKSGPGSPRNLQCCACRDGVDSSERRERAKDAMACGASSLCVSHGQ